MEDSAFPKTDHQRQDVPQALSLRLSVEVSPPIKTDHLRCARAFDSLVNWSYALLVVVHF